MGILPSRMEHSRRFEKRRRRISIVDENAAADRKLAADMQSDDDDSGYNDKNDESPADLTGCIMYSKCVRNKE